LVVVAQGLGDGENAEREVETSYVDDQVGKRDDSSFIPFYLSRRVNT
jgi:hypothetical protein